MFDLNSGEVLAVIWLVAVIFLYRRQQVFISLLKNRVRLAGAQRVERATMPAQTAQLLDGARQELEAAGFRYELTQAAAPVSLFDPRTLVFSDHYWHPEKATLAVARLAEPYTGQAVSVYFLTGFADGKKLLTTNRILWAMFPTPPDETMAQDAYADNFHDQWKFHQAALEKEAASRTVVDNLDEVLQREQGGLARIYAHMRAIGWIREDSPGIFRFTARGAWRYARQQIREGTKARAALKRPYQHSPAPDAEAQRSAEMHAFASATELAAQPLPQWVKAVMFGLTLLVSVALFGQQISVLSAVALLLVLLVHELGHLIAMWAFGFRNLSIIFLPLLGAVATGHKTHVKPWQEAVILLAGPVPGLVAALLATQVSLDGLAPQTADFFRMCFWFALLLNLFNLLPLSILDGGKLFQLAVLSRFPYARVIFSALGSTIGLTYALMHRSPVLAIAMTIVLLSLGYQFRAAQAVAAIRARARAQGMASGSAQLGKEEAVALLGQHLARPEFSEPSAKGWALRTTTARIAYPALLQGVPGLGTALGVLAAQATAFFAPVLIASWLIHQPGQVPILRQNNAEQIKASQQAQEQMKASAKAAREKFLARYDAERDPEAKWEMLQMDEDEKGEPLFLDPDWIARQSAELIKLLPADHPAKLEPLLEQARAGNPRAAEIALSVIRQITGGDLSRAVTLDPARFGTLQAAYDHLARVAAPEVLAAQAARLDALWPQFDNPSQSPWRKQALASTAAHLAFAAGDPRAAGIWMDRQVASSSSKNPWPAYTHGWFLLDVGRANQALELATHAIDAPDTQNHMRQQWRALAGWAEMARGRPREADAYFQAALVPVKGKREEEFDVGTWLLGLILNDRTRRVPEYITDGMLDHLAALESYDPQEAARYRAELAARVTPEWKQYIAPQLTGMVDGWGKVREAALVKLAKTL